MKPLLAILLLGLAALGQDALVPPVVPPPTKTVVVQQTPKMGGSVTLVVRKFPQRTNSPPLWPRAFALTSSFPAHLKTSTDLRSWTYSGWVSQTPTLVTNSGGSLYARAEVWVTLSWAPDPYDVRVYQGGDGQWFTNSFLAHGTNVLEVPAIPGTNYFYAVETDGTRESGWSSVVSYLPPVPTINIDPAP